MKKILCALGFLFCVSAINADERSMSLNTEIQVLPAPGPVVIDGKTDDWDLSAGVWSYNDPTLVGQYSLWTHLMWDDKGVYLLARYNDPNPMKNAASGKDFQQSWRADCYQARVIFDDRAKDEHIMHVNMYYSSFDDKPYMIIKHGGFKNKEPYDATGPDRPDQLEKWGPTMANAGGSIAFAAWPDGKGYNMEAFWPWKYCRTSGEPLKPGDAFVFGIEAMWGNIDGSMLSQRLADGIKDDNVNRIFMFRARTGWGKAAISDKGKLQITEQQIELQKIRLKNFEDYDSYGSVQISYELPEKRDVTIAIDDEQGKRVRNLFGQYPRDAGKITDKWDCLDDNGNAVKPGKYKATVVHHLPIALKLYNSCYSSATPPWVTDAGKKLWGSNHGHPTSVATSGKSTILLFTGTEGGSGIQLINDDAIIQWTDGNEFVDGTMDDKFAYGLSRSGWQKKTLLFKFKLKDGQLVVFDDADKSPTSTLLPDTEITNSSSIALAHGSLWVCFPGRALQKVNPSTGAVEQTIEVGNLLAVTDRDDKLYGLYSDGKVATLDAAAKPTDIFKAEGLEKPVRLGISHDGKRFAISDTGVNQVIIFSPEGKKLNAVGSVWKGEDRPAGKFIMNDLVRPLGADFDHLGRLWITESVKTCKRVTCWDEQYKMIDQYWGQADYGAMSGFPLVFDPTRFIAHGVEFKLDPNPDPWKRKTNEQPIVYHPELANERGFIYDYKGHEYACGVPGFNKPDDLSIFKRDKAGIFRRCVKINFAKVVKGKPEGGRAWIDKNDNHAEDAGEVTEKVDFRSIYWSNGWVRPDMTIMSTNGLRFDLKGMTAEGVPLYDFAKPETIKNWVKISANQGSCGSPIMDMAGNVSDGISYSTVDGRTGSYPNLYGRHDAPAARRGVLIAPFRTNGVVEDIPNIGSMTALGGDRGEWFLMSMDGIYLSSICQDSKSRITLDETFIGQESFGGFIWRDKSSKKVYVQLGGASYRLMEVKNLETCVKEVKTLNVGDKDIAEGVEIAKKRQQQAVPEPDTLRVAKVNKLPTEPAPVLQAMNRPLIDGSVDFKVGEPGNPAVWWRASLAHNNKDLAVMFQVSDSSPWKNGQGQFTHAFIGGDCVDLQLDVPGRGPIRILAASVGGKNTVTYWQSKASQKENPMTYMVGNNVANATEFDVVKRLDSAKVAVDAGINTYTVLLTIPLKDIGLDKAIGSKITGVLGVIYSDPSGTNRAMRLYWHNKKTGLVSDVPSEARLDSKLWGMIELDK
ncbi:MAG TPA: hypothetical protein DCZ94_11570 [Lentisphaeria bacterium]|nr:MAG: hypothetical protein A2X48_17660 [Lentisphaerae bacterium GWF2_49_21]HBC87586.1 hypothetical protein [Lentisphaeria bacterium]